MEFQMGIQKVSINMRANDMRVSLNEPNDIVVRIPRTQKHNTPHKNHPTLKNVARQNFCRNHYGYIFSGLLVSPCSSRFLLVWSRVVFFFACPQRLISLPFCSLLSFYHNALSSTFSFVSLISLIPLISSWWPYQCPSQ